MSDWEEDEPTVAAVNFNSVAGNLYAPHGGDNRRRDFNLHNGFGNRDQSYDQRNRDESRDRRNDRFDDGDAISFEIDHRHVGKVIGRGGCTVKEIQQKYNVDLNIGKWIVLPILAAILGLKRIQWDFMIFSRQKSKRKRTGEHYHQRWIAKHERCSQTY